MSSESSSTEMADRQYIWAGQFYRAFVSAPLELRAFAVFSLVVVTADFGIEHFGSKHLHEVLIPLTGWVASMPYMFSIFFVFSLMFTRDYRQRFVIDFQLLLQIIYGLWQLSRIRTDNFNNPYLTVSHWQPIWTILIPLLWIAALHSPRMNRFCHRVSSKHVA